MYGNWTFRSQDHSLPGANGPGVELSLLGTFAPWNIRSLDFSLLGTFAPTNKCRPSKAINGTFAPWNFRSPLRVFVRIYFHCSFEAQNSPWTAVSDWTGLTLLNGFPFLVTFLYCYILVRVVD